MEPGFHIYVLLPWHLLVIYKLICAKALGFYFCSDLFMEKLEPAIACLHIAEKLGLYAEIA